MSGNVRLEVDQETLVILNYMLGCPLPGQDGEIIYIQEKQTLKYNSKLNSTHIDSSHFLSIYIRLKISAIC